MIKTKQELIQALKTERFIGVVIYAGPSKIDGAPIIAIANKITSASDNGKTGDMVQTFIMRSDIPPHHAIKTGDDISVCGNCASRPSLKGDKICYVRVYQSPLSVYNAYHRGRYAVPGIDFNAKLIPELFSGLAIRFGSYGDPFAVPVKLWLAMASRAKTWTGYSHQWRKASKSLATLCMASADNASEVSEANAKGWRTFRVKKLNEQNLVSEFGCPAARENGQRTNCANCSLCKGSSIVAKNAVIIDHGPRRARTA